VYVTILRDNSMLGNAMAWVRSLKIFNGSRNNKYNILHDSPLVSTGIIALKL